MLKVAFLTDAPRVAGSEIWLLEVLPLLAQMGFEPWVFLPSNPSLLYFKTQLEEAGIHTFTYQDIAPIIPVLSDFHARVLQAWFPKTYDLLNRLPKPRLVFVHDQLEYHYPLELDRVYRMIYRLTKASRIRAADRIMVGTYWAADYLRKHFALDAYPVPSGVNADKFRPPSPTEREELRQKLGFDRFTVLTPARFALEKNHLAVLRTAKALPEVDFILVGSGDLLPFFRFLTALLRLKNVRFLGNRWDVADIYRASDAMLFPTLADNPGLVILEAMSSELPVITSPFPPQAEVISPEEGWLVPPTPRALAQAVRWIMEHPDEAKARARRGRARVLAERTTFHTAKALAQCLHEAIHVQSS